MPSTSRPIDSAPSLLSLPLPMFLLPSSSTLAHNKYHFSSPFPSAHERERVRHALIVALPQFCPSQIKTKILTLIKTYLFVITPISLYLLSSSSHALYDFFVGYTSVYISFIAYSVCISSSTHGFVLISYRPKRKREREGEGETVYTNMQKSNEKQGGSGESERKEQSPLAVTLSSDLFISFPPSLEAFVTPPRKRLALRANSGYVIDTFCIEV